MFRNYVNLHDLNWAARKLPSRLDRVARTLLRGEKQRTIDLYSGEPGSDQWWVVPAVERRWNLAVSGDPDVDHYQYLSDKYLGDGGLVGLSVGCGEGQREQAWARTGRFSTLVGVDLTPASIEKARRRADDAGLDDVLEFRVGDLTETARWRPDGFDVVIGEHSVHHLSPLRSILLSLRAQLVPGGLFLLDEYVGPTRFQWTPEQLECANHLLGLLPERLRREQSGAVKRSVTRPSILYMKLKDPSEAIESARILPLMEELFERIELRPYGGTVLHIVLAGIAHNFVDPDPDAVRYLRMLFEAEDVLLESGRLRSDFVVGVFRKP